MYLPVSRVWWHIQFIQTLLHPGSICVGKINMNGLFLVFNTKTVISMPADISPDLLYLIAQGDTTAFRKFFDAYKDRLFIFVEQLIHSRADAEEIVQDTFMKVWQNAAKLVEIDQPGYYIYTIARNNTLNYIRKHSQQQRLAEIAYSNQLPWDDTLQEKLKTREAQEIINNALAGLSGQKQHIYRLSRESGMSHAEIANLLGLSQSRVKNIIVETLKHIKVQLQTQSDLLALIFWMEYCRLLF